MKRKRLEVRALPGALLVALTAGTAEADTRAVEGVASGPEEDIHPCLEMMEPCLMVEELPELTTLQQAQQWTQQLDYIPEEPAQKAVREGIVLDILTLYRRVYAEEGADAIIDLREGFAVFEAYARTFRRAYGDDAPIRADLVEAATELLADINKAERAESGDTSAPPTTGDGPGEDARPPCLTPLPAERGCKRDGSTAALLLLLPLAVRRRKMLAKVEHRLPADVVERLKKE